MTRQPIVVPKKVVQEVVQLPVIPEAAAPAPAKPMRTLEEVRADLARLRERSRERQAQAPVPRDTGFAPTDFMDFVPSVPQSSHREGPDSSFAPTDFMDLVPPVLESPGQEEPESNFASTASLDFSTFKVRGVH